MDADRAIKAYLELRDRKSRINREAKEKVAEVEEKMEKIADYLANVMAKVGTQSLKGESGIAFPETKTRVSVSDAEAFRAYIVNLIRGGDDNAISLLNAAANKTNVIAMFDMDCPPPDGVAIEKYKEIVVRRKS